jgi:hypothetical protein
VRRSIEFKIVREEDMNKRSSMIGRARRRVAHAALIAMGVLLMLPIAVRTAGAVAGGEVHGTIYAQLRKEGNSSTPIFLPDINVFLVDQKTSARSVALKTNFDGAFAIPSQPEAVYRLCWDSPRFTPGCAPQSFVLRRANTNLRPIAITPKNGVIFGRVTFKDGVPCRFVAPIFGVNVIAEVAAVPASGPTAKVHTDSAGYYVIGELPAGQVTLTAACEGAVVSSKTTASELAHNLVLPNIKPSVASYAVAGDAVVRSAAPGSVVTVRTEVLSDGGYPLNYRWATDPPQADFTSTNNPTTAWTVPGSRLATMYVLATDGRGGYALNKVALSTTPDRIVFSGKVSADNAPAVAGATVTVNGAATTTDANGGFMVAVKGESPSYVATIEKPGYKLWSRILHAPVTGANFKLFSAQVYQVDPTNGFTVIEKRSEEQTRTTGDNTHGQGVELVFESDAVGSGADGRGALVVAPIKVQVGTYAAHNSDDQLPGDYAGLDKEGKAVRLSSAGASHVSLRDLAGHPLNIAPGKSAILRQPIDAALVAAAPPTIPFWSYDEKRGVWVQEGVAAKVGSAYEAKVTHFSAVNMDLANANGGACTKVIVDTSIMPPFQLRMTPLTGPGEWPDHQNQWVSDDINVIVREPPNTQIQFDVVDGDGNVLPAASQTITTGAASPTGEQCPSPPPAPGDQNAYSDCTTTLRYDFAHVSVLFPTPSPDFTTFLTYLTPSVFLPANAAQAAAANALTVAYYQKIDPLGTKTAGNTSDFTNWKTLNGFDAGDDAHTSYLNNYDLGFGRDMHMKRGGQSGACPTCVAFYVTNYHTADDASAQANPIATVAMEYSPLPSGGSNYTKFYVFGPTGAISTTAALDDNGPKYVPALCAICHNGDLTNAAPTGDASGNLTTSRFIPFDLDSFGYPAGVQQSDATVQAQFKAMNQGVLATNVSVAVQALVRNWYGSETDPTLPNATFNGGAVPSGWLAPTDESVLYNATVKPYCRACHTTRDPNDISAGNNDITWNSYDSLDQSSARFFVCSSGKKMPQAERNYGRFWFGLSPHGPAAFAASPVDGGGACH